MTNDEYIIIMMLSASIMKFTPKYNSDNMTV